jgi:hypothetical protein
MMAFVETSRGIKADFYFCTACHTGDREAKNALGHSSVFIDADVHDITNGLCHPVVVAVVFIFCKTAGIPNPSAIVATGSGGLHIYWWSDRTLKTTEWEPFACALREAAKHFEWQKTFDRVAAENNLPTAKIKIDLGLTTDAARVLRVPGPDFHNHKHNPPRPVGILPRWSTGVRYDFVTIFNDLKDKVYKPEGFVLGEAVEPRKLGPMPFAPIMAGCSFLRTAYETGGKDYTEPQWHLTTLCAVFLENGNELVHKFGVAHPGYNHESTEDKWDNSCRARDDKGVGWPSCKTISSERPNDCESCPHFAKGKTPFHLALDVIRDREDEQLLRELDATRPEKLYLPKEFAVSNKTNHICKIIPARVVRNVAVPPYLLEVFKCVISDPIPQMINGHRGVSFTATVDLGCTVRAFVSMADFIPNVFKKQDVNVCGNKKAAEALMEFGESWLDKMHRIKKSRELTSLGWRFEDGKIDGFVYGGTYFAADGTTTSSGLNSENHVLKWYQPAGNREAWYHAAKLLTARKRVELDTLLCAGFAAPLMVFAGNIYGGVLSGWGQAGTSKSTAQQLACAIWAHPKQGRESINSTSKSVLNKLGMLKNLPAWWDDIQDEQRQEQLFQATFVNTQGMEGSRLDTNVVQRVRGEWQTLMVACSNASFCEYIIRKQPSTTAGIRRVLEFEINRDPNETGLADAFDANKAYAELEHNYGWVGYGYAQILAAEHAQIEAMVGETIKRFKDKVKGTPEETYWWGIAGVLVVGANMAVRMGVEVDPARIEDFLVDVFRKNRELRNREATEGGSLDNTHNALIQFLIHYIGKGHRLRRPRAGSRWVRIKESRGPREGCPLYIDILEEDRELRISKKQFRTYLFEQKIQPRQVLEGLVTHFGATVDVFKTTLGSGTDWAVAQEDVIKIPIPEGSALEDLLHDLEKDEDD